VTARVFNTGFPHGGYPNDSPVAVSTSEGDGLYARLVDWSYASLLNFHNHLAARYY